MSKKPQAKTLELPRIESAVEAISVWRSRFNDPALFFEPEKVTEEQRAILPRVSGFSDPGHQAANLAALCRTVWAAYNANEMIKGDLGPAIWALSEYAELIAEAASVEGDASALERKIAEVKK